MGTNAKAEAARSRKSAAEAEKKEREFCEREDLYWKEAEGTKSRAAKKREEKEEKRAQATARRAENRKIAEQERLDLEKSARRPDSKAKGVSAPVPKVTVAELSHRREEERLRLEREAEAAKKRLSRTTEEDQYKRMVLVGNTNRDDSVVEARSVEEAIAVLAVNDASLPPDRHPELVIKRSFKVFEESELARLKEEKPGLSLAQYKDMIWKLWKKSPSNPFSE
ncbi:hypothetical protein HPP92_022057 [Vanilla planifolia]|uniref:Coiled-coil domain-containing protein n=1 Tax=Vanilla planifolia TaxID=51239 RepID=A0A835PSN0_VANPL|nr:hypothetical protein HPP92_022389 [Vanilla planifolia]KAG0458929.1 hypothetical protein HPP92_022057 [Vanilla planifolia]